MIGSTYGNVREVRVQNTSILIVSPMNLEEMSTEILYDGFIIVAAVAKGSYASKKKSYVMPG